MNTDEFSMIILCIMENFVLYVYFSTKYSTIHCTFFKYIFLCILALFLNYTRLVIGNLYLLISFKTFIKSLKRVSFLFHFAGMIMLQYYIYF